MKRFSLTSDYIQGICDIEEDPHGDWIKHSDFEKVVEALKKIRDQDYRGNVPPSVEVARQTLKELGVE